MTEEIIIDGVDVSKCEWSGQIDLDINIICNSNSPKKCSSYCKDNPNCHYKQLAREKKKCEELRKWKEDVVNLFEKTCKCKYLDKESAYCSFYNKECTAINKCLYRNQQALADIKEISESVLKNVSKTCIETTPMYCVHKQILQKIREVGE